MPRFGPAGIPTITKPKDVIKGIEDVNKLGLDLMELEFVYSVWIQNNEKGLKRAEEIKKKSEELDVLLTAHAPYFINLASPDEKKVKASIQRIVDCARASYWVGARYVVTHLGYYGKLSKEEAYEVIKKNLEEAVQIIQDRGYKVYISPETLGKVSQFGSLEEVVSLCEEVDGLWPTIDFAHLHARTGGGYKDKAAYEKTLDYIEEHLGSEVVRKLHIHFSGIEYNEKGEKKHIILRHADISFRDLAEVLVDMGLNEVTIVSESPILEQDALYMKQIYEEVLKEKGIKK
ncbi:MAG TPA: hypothetical protein ENI59_01090 [Euryarchaeota archaeon]|nr:hypothetical protein [Euryarchaeota archaeon]